jgi:membrane protein required for colicin V production
MTYLDYFFIFIISSSFLIGCYRGFTRELLSLIGWIFAFYFAHYFSGDFMKYAPFKFGEQINFIIIYVSIFVVILLIASFLAFLINKIIKTIGLGPLNIILGCLFGFMRGILISFVIIFLVEKTLFINELTLSKSKTIPTIKLFMQKTLSYLPNEWSNKVKYHPII